MQISPIQQNNTSFGYQIKRNKLMKNVFQYNKDLLKEKDFNSVAKFCEAISNIYKKTPRNGVFSCRGEVRLPWELGGSDDANSLILNVIVKSPDDTSVISSGFRLTSAHLNGKRNPYDDADKKLVRDTNSIILRDFYGSSKVPLEFESKFLTNLAAKWNRAKTEVEKDSVLNSLDKRLDDLESRMK